MFKSISAALELTLRHQPIINGPPRARSELFWAISGACWELLRKSVATQLLRQRKLGSDCFVMTALRRICQPRLPQEVKDWLFDGVKMA